MADRLEAFVSGRVQGVTYRYFTQGTAQRLQITGTVENVEDGRVHIIAEGERTQLEIFLARLNHGPLFAHVSGVEHAWKHATGEFTSFDILYPRQ